MTQPQAHMDHVNTQKDDLGPHIGADIKAQHNQPEYQTYREALSLIRYGLSQKTQIDSFDFLADIYKRSPVRLKSVFVMALISTLTSLNFALKAMEDDKRHHEGGVCVD